MQLGCDFRQGEIRAENSPGSRHLSLIHASTFQGHKSRSPEDVNQKNLITLASTFTFHGGDTEIHSKRDANRPTRLHRPAKPTMPQLLFLPTSITSASRAHTHCRAKYFSNWQLQGHTACFRAECPTSRPAGHRDVAGFPASLQDCRHDPKWSGTSVTPPPAMHGEPEESQIYACGALLLGWSGGPGVSDSVLLTETLLCFPCQRSTLQ